MSSDGEAVYGHADDGIIRRTRALLSPPAGQRIARPGPSRSDMAENATGVTCNDAENYLAALRDSVRAMGTVTAV